MSYEGYPELLSTTPSDGSYLGLESNNSGKQLIIYRSIQIRGCRDPQILESDLGVIAVEYQIVVLKANTFCS